MELPVPPPLIRCPSMDTMSICLNKPLNVRIGAGILLQPSDQQVLKRLGILEDISRVAQPLDGLSAILKSDRQLVRLKYEWLDPTLCGLGEHRGELFELLLNNCLKTNVTIHTGSRIERAGSDSALEWIECSGGRFDGFDFLIPTDGSASRIRGSSQIRSKVIERSDGDTHIISFSKTPRGRTGTPTLLVFQEPKI